MNADKLNEIGEYFLAGHCRCISENPMLKYASGLNEVYNNSLLHIDGKCSFAPADTYYWKDKKGFTYCFPMYNGTVVFDPNKADQKKLLYDDPNVTETIEASKEYWKAYDINLPTSRHLNEIKTQIPELSNLVPNFRGFFGAWQGHATLDYATILKKGFIYYKNLINGKFRNSNSEIDRKKYDYYQSLSIVINGIENLIRRSISECDLLISAGNCPDTSRIQLLKSAFEQMLTGIPQNFYQALQYVHFFCAVDNYDNIGRMDQYLYPFYKKDADCGRIDSRTAENFFVEIFEIWSKHNFWNVVVGGQKADGTDASNELTYIIMDARKRVLEPKPSLSLRFSPQTPDDLLVKAFEALNTGLGQPAIYNDELYIKELESIGIPKEDAVEFSFGGCSETHIAGKGAARDEAFNLCTVMELLLNNVEVHLQNGRIKLKTVDSRDYSNFDEFLSAYKNLAELMIDAFVYCRNQTQQMVASLQPALVRSIFISDCINKGLSHSEGGALYNHGLIDVYGVPNVANSLFAIKKLIFDDKVISLLELTAALKNNFKGYENIRNLCVGQHKYGNDLDDVDEIAKEVSNHIFRYIRQHKIWNGDIYYGFCASAPGYHVTYGELTGATPDGRLAGTPLANSMGPMQGTEKEGITAVFNSITKLDLFAIIGSPVVNISLGENLFVPDHYDRLASLIKTYFKKGGMQLQFSIVDRETLKDAVIHPELHGNLMIRVSGYCARFVELPANIQQEIIERTIF